MLHIQEQAVRDHLLDGEFGLEKESLRVRRDGTFSHTPHPFPNRKNIVRDFCENQVEINTGVHTSVRGAIAELGRHTSQIQKTLRQLPEQEHLWQFSNPPYIHDEEDIPVASFEGVEVSKTAYRDYLSDKYGRYKMTFSGIHVNFSFAESLLQADFRLSGETDYTTYKNKLYLELAQKMALYGWLLVAVTAASPLMDSSYVEKGVFGQDIFTGMASVRCSEMGYWNEFTPVFDYTDIASYVDSIQNYVDLGLIRAPSELYYPIRIKPRGENSLDSLRKHGVNHIELRMFDLNPLREEGLEEKDVVFAQLMMVWLASSPARALSEKDQIQAVQNFKNAARYDLKTVKIVAPDEKICSVVQAAIHVIEQMQAFYNTLDIDVHDVLTFEYEKFTDAENRYAWQIRGQYSDGFVKKALQLAKERQDQYDV